MLSIITQLYTYNINNPNNYYDNSVNINNNDFEDEYNNSYEE